MMQGKKFVWQEPVNRVALLDFKQFFTGAFEDFLSQRQRVELHSPHHASKFFELLVAGEPAAELKLLSRRCPLSDADRVSPGRRLFCCVFQLLSDLDRFSLK